MARTLITERYLRHVFLNMESIHKYEEIDLNVEFSQLVNSTFHTRRRFMVLQSPYSTEQYHIQYITEQYHIQYVYRKDSSAADKRQNISTPMRIFVI